MRTHRKSGFTLVEILIVVVILGILAAIVVPQFTSASQEAIKGALASQLQTVNSQIELFRVRNQGAYPDLIEDTTFLDADENSGWGMMVGGEYLKEVPMNGFTSSGVIVAGSAADALGEDRNSVNGWYYSNGEGATDYGTVYAAGYDQGTNTLNGDPDYPAGE